MLRKLILPCLLCATLSACGGEKPLYSWGDYPKALLSYSKNPDQGAKFSATLETTIKKAEAKRNVPPGLYAEYGYMLLDQGKAPEAIAYFQKERDRWPEAAPLMDKIIARLSAAPIASSASAGAGGSATPSQAQ